MKSYWVYILCSKRNGTLYIGVTNDLTRRIYEHKQKIADSFTKKYNVTQLVHAEEFQDINDALSREKILKKWRRAEKLQLIEECNPEWEDLYENILGAKNLIKTGSPLREDDSLAVREDDNFDMRKDGNLAAGKISMNNVIKT